MGSDMHDSNAESGFSTDVGDHARERAAALGGSDVLYRPYTVGEGFPTPLDPPPPSPLLPMFEADSQNFASVPSVPRGFKLQNFLRGP